MGGVISHVHAVADRVSEVFAVVPDSRGSRVNWADEATRAELLGYSVADLAEGLLT